MSDSNCTLLLHNEENEVPRKDELRAMLERGDDDTKIEALKQVILFILNGEQKSMSTLLVHVIKFCVHSNNKIIKKLLLLFWEVVAKTSSDGRLLPEMILVCNAMKNNLVHANEYVRGSTLRFLCNLKQQEILESIMPSITANLEHRHSYVRKYAVIAVYTIYEANAELLPDAPDLIEKFLYAEANSLSMRNAFLMLLQCDQEKALGYLDHLLEQDKLSNQEEGIQLVALKLVRKVCRSNPFVKAQYVRPIYNLTNSPSNAVAFEASNTLISLSSAPTAVRAAVGAYTRLLSTESDNNVKLIILDRLCALRRRHERLLRNSVMDVVRTLAVPNIDIQRKTIELTLSLVCQDNVDEILTVLRKELLATEAAAAEAKQQIEYRKLLVSSMHKCAVKFPNVAAGVVNILMADLGDENESFALDIIFIVRETVEENEELRDEVVSKLMEAFPTIQSSEVYRVALWVLAEHAVVPAVLDFALSTIRDEVGDLDLIGEVLATTEGEEKAETKEESAAVLPVQQTVAKPVLLPDGTYAQQSAQEEKGGGAKEVSAAGGKSLRNFLLKGDYFLAVSIASAVAKLLLRFCTICGYGSAESNAEVARGLLLMGSLLELGSHPKSPHPIGPDSRDRILLFMHALMNPKPTADVFLTQCREGFATMLRKQRQSEEKQRTEQIECTQQQPDAVIQVHQLRGMDALHDVDPDEAEQDLRRAVGAVAKTSAAKERVFQLTGYSDPVYAEATLCVNEYDIVLEILVVNQTKQTLRDLSVELSTSSDLKVVERPQTYNIAPFDFVEISVSIKASSTENGVIFGNIVYNHETIVVLNCVQMDVMDYIQPATCSPAKFRTMWAEFEWENKVAVNTEICDVMLYLSHVVKITNMRCMTSEGSLAGNSMSLAANLYGCSIFGEDALLNVSVETKRDGKVGGYIRIRSKTQGIALSLGDKITAAQRSIHS